MSYGNLDALIAALNAAGNLTLNTNSLIYREDPNFGTGLSFLVIAAKAKNLAEERYPDSSDIMKRDAFRHGYWSALLTDAFGAVKAEVMTTAYEDATPNNDGISRDMDIYNNEIGRNLADGKYFSSYDQCGDMIVDALNNGDFKVIEDNKLVPSSYCGKVYVISKIKDGVTDVRKEPCFFSSRGYGSLPYGEVVLNLGNEGPFTKILYYPDSGPDSGKDKPGYVYSKYLLPIEQQNQSITTDSNGNSWYNPYCDDYVLTQAFNDLDTKLEGHLGHDIGKSGSNIPVKAILGGTVVFVNNSDSNTGNGTMVQIKHTINGKVFYSFYSHMVYNSLKVNTTDKKDIVAGQTLGIMGDTGNAAGAHIHLGVYTGPLNESPSGYYRWTDEVEKYNIIDFKEDIDNSENRTKALQNALLVKGTKYNDTTRVYYDFLEVIKSEASIID